MTNSEKPIANPHILLREEFDDWAVLFDPDTGRGSGLNPAGVHVWKRLDGEHTLDGLLEELRAHADKMPADARDHIGAFVDALVAEGLAATDGSVSGQAKCSDISLVGPIEVTLLAYEAPRLINLNSPQAALGKTCASHGSQAAHCCSGAGASTSCSTGTCPGYPSSCCNGNGDTNCCSSGPAPKYEIRFVVRRRQQSFLLRCGFWWLMMLAVMGVR